MIPFHIDHSINDFPIFYKISSNVELERLIFLTLLAIKRHSVSELTPLRYVKLHKNETIFHIISFLKPHCLSNLMVW